MWLSGGVDPGDLTACVKLRTGHLIALFPSYEMSPAPSLFSPSRTVTFPVNTGIDQGGLTFCWSH